MSYLTKDGLCMEKEYKTCKRCIMDTTDPNIEFDERGYCNHCREAESIFNSEPLCLNPKEKEERLKKLIDEIKEKGKNKKYDCIIGVSGGADSSYVAYLTKKLGLRPLAVHLDNGWDSKLSVTNIERLLKKLGIDLHTHVIDWEEFKDLQLSFLKASTPDSEIPSDHAIIAILYKIAAKYNVNYILAGTNTSTESILPTAWSHGHYDWKYINSIHKKFGKSKLKTYPHLTLLDFFVYNFIKKIKWISILNYVDYKRENAIKILKEEMGWEFYGRKHYESIYTKFFQGYILPTKFGFDKRKAHLSSMILSGQITREEALKEIKKDIYPSEELKQDTDYIINKLGLTKEEFEQIMALPPKTFWDYPSHEKSWYFSIGMFFYNLSGKKI